MADSDQSYKIQVIFELLNQGKVEEAKQQLTELSATARDFSASMPASSAGLEKYKSALGDAGDASEKLRGQIHELRSLIADAGPEAARLGKLLDSAFDLNPAGLAFNTIALGLEETFGWIEKTQQKFRNLIDDGMRVNKILADIVAARPTGEQQWETFIGQMARLNSEFSSMRDNAKFVADQFTTVQKGIDENTVRNSFAGARPAAERKVITDEIANDQENLAHLKQITGSAAAAQQRADETANHLADLKRQAENLPKAIAEANKNADTAEAQAKASSYVPEKGNLYQYAEGQWDAVKRMQAELDTARAGLPAAETAAAAAATNLKTIEDNTREINNLAQKIVELQNRLGVFDINQRQSAAHKVVEDLSAPIGGVIDADRAMATGRQLDQAQNQTFSTLQQYLEKAHFNTQAILRIIADGVHQGETNDRILQAIQNQIQQLGKTP